MWPNSNSNHFIRPIYAFPGNLNEHHSSLLAGRQPVVLRKWKFLTCVWLFATLWTIQSMEFSRSEYWSGFGSVRSLSHVRLFATPWTTAHQASLSITNSWSPPKPMCIESVMPSNHLILCRPLLLLSSIFPSIRVFSNLHQVAKVLEFQLKHQSFQWTPRTDFLWDGLVGSPCSARDSQESSPTPQFKSINSSVLSFLYSPTLTSIHDYLTRQTSVGNVSAF